MRAVAAQIRMAEEKEAKRLADLDALREKTLAKYRAAGGESRELDLAAKAAADEAKAEREAQEYARKLDEDIRRRKVRRRHPAFLALRSPRRAYGLCRCHGGSLTSASAPAQLEAKERTNAQLRSIDEQRERQRQEKQAEREEARRLGNDLQAEVSGRSLYCVQHYLVPFTSWVQGRSVI